MLSKLQNIFYGKRSDGSHHNSSKLRQMTKHEVLERIVEVKQFHKVTTPRTAPPVHPVRRFSDPRSTVIARVIPFQDNDSYFSLNGSYNENSLISYMHQCFDIIEQLGEGSFGRVFKVKDRQTNEFFAIKVSKTRFRNSNDRIAKLREVEKHGIIPKHTNCVQLFSAWEQDSSLYLQIELCETSLESFCQYLLVKNVRLYECSLWEILFDILMALQNLHNRDYIHMDVKSANIFVSAEGICKLGDFGLLLDTTQVTGTEEEGDGKYLAAEVLRNIYTKQADIFSLGIVVLELACNQILPSSGPEWQNLRHGLIPIESLTHLSQDMIAVISSMLHPDYTKRPSVNDLLKHPRFSGIEWKRFVGRQLTIMSQQLCGLVMPVTRSFSLMIHSVFGPVLKIISMLSNSCKLFRSQKTYESSEIGLSDNEDPQYDEFVSHIIGTPGRNVGQNFVNSTPMCDQSNSAPERPSKSRLSMMEGQEFSSSLKRQSVKTIFKKNLRGKNLFQDN